MHTTVAEVSRGVKHFIGAAESAAVSAGTLNERALELEQFLTMEDGNPRLPGNSQFPSQGKHGD
jgi:hypothetical protein